MNLSYEVRVQGIRTQKGVQRDTHTARWVVGGKRFGKSFRTKALAESFRSELLIAERRGVAFDMESGLPEPMARKLSAQSWLTLAMDFADSKWPHSAAKHRASIADALATLTPALLTSERGRPAPDELRAALYGWAFNKGRRDTEEMPADVARIIKWATENTADVTALSDSGLVRKALDRAALRLDGSGAVAANTINRRRGIFYGALKYAVEMNLIPSHPFERVSWKAPKTDGSIDRRTVVNVVTAGKLIEASGELAPHLKAFYGAMYYSALRPEETLHLTPANYSRPVDETGWGWLNLTGATVGMNAAWNDGTDYYEDRALKHRAKQTSRRVPVPPALALLLDEHIDRYQVPATGRLFVTRTGTNPGRPVSTSTYTRIWRRTREKVLTPAQVDSPLARCLTSSGTPA